MVDLDSIKIAPEVLNLIPKATALELLVLPLKVERDCAVVAVRDNHDPKLLQDISFFLGKRVEPELVETEILQAAIRRFYGISNLEVHRTSVSQQPEFHSVSEEASTAASVPTDGSVVNLVNRIISDAIRMHASDIHIESYERLLRVRFRLDGALHEVIKPPPEIARALVSRLKVMADLDISEKRRPQDGRIRVKESDRTIDIRVSTLPTDFGEKIVLRILDKSQLQLDLCKLGFEERELRLFQRTLKLPYGMVLVTGPTGSGKTTTLYAALNYINDPEINITTIEDPIEYNLKGVNQTHVRPDIDLTFASALRSILRQDPDVIMLGEVRDGETAEIAVRAALTGHLVFSTLHTNDAASAITRLIDMGVEPFLVASSIKMILAQRLLRKLCDHCKVPARPSNEEVEILKLASQDAMNIHRKNGCAECHNSGYSGRTAIYEVLSITNDLSDRITHGAGSAEIRQKAQADGMTTLRDSAIQKAARGETTLEEVIHETAC